MSRRLAWIFACAAGLLGALYAAVGAYWAVGGTALLDTVGGTVERVGRTRATGVLVFLWITVALKLVASGVGLLAVAQPRWLSERRYRFVRGVAWMAAVILVLYGGVLTLVGVLVQADVVPASAHADQKALRWHAFLWDPWFLVWGALLAAAVALSTRPSIDRHRTDPSRSVW